MISVMKKNECNTPCNKFKATFNVKNRKIFHTNDEIVTKLAQIVRNFLNGTFYRGKAQSPKPKAFSLVSNLRKVDGY